MEIDSTNSLLAREKKWNKEHLELRSKDEVKKRKQ